MSELVAGAPSKSRTWFGHPPGLTVIFLTQMWEIFSFYGMRALLVYYMTKQLLLGQEQASLVYGLYTAFVYFTPILGGPLADRWLGRRKAVIIGGSIMALGHFMMASEDLLYAALATIALGNGLFLPNLPSQILGLYRPDDPRRGSAFNIYYVGINLGGFLSPLVCGYLGETYGWHYGFTAAGVGMAAGLAVYIVGGRHLPPELPRQVTAPSVRQDRRQTLTLLLGVAFAIVVFRVAYEQTGNTVALWADAGVDRALYDGGWLVPMTWFQSLNPLLVIVLTPFLVAQWTAAARGGREPAPLIKMATGAAIVAVAFVMAAALNAYAGPTKISWLWLAGFFVVLTVGELFILPVGMALFGRLAPPRAAGTTIATWFLASFAGNLLAGVFGTLWDKIGHAPFFLLAAVAAALASSFFVLLNRHEQRLGEVGQ